jgi:hypothetical protein
MSPMPMQLAKRITWTAALPLLLVLAGCVSDGGGFPDLISTGSIRSEPPKPAAPAINMAGRWQLASPSGGVCGVNFTAAPGATSGKIAPEGGCPGRFFTSRQWAFDQGALVIYDHKDKPLARLASSEPPGRFEGKAVSGIEVALSR